MIRLSDRLQIQICIVLATGRIFVQDWYTLENYRNNIDLENPFLVNCQSFIEMENLTINGKSSRMFRFPHMLLPTNVTSVLFSSSHLFSRINRKNLRIKNYNRAPRKPFLSGNYLSSRKTECR